MRLRCSECGSAIPSEQINTLTDIAYCPECLNVEKISVLVTRSSLVEDVVANPPAGTWFRQSTKEITVGGTTRSGMAIILLPFTLVWCWSWFNAQFGLIQEGIHMENLVFYVFAGASSLLLLWQLLRSMYGKVEVSIQGDFCQVFEGVWVVGRRRSVALSDILSIQ